MDIEKVKVRGLTRGEFKALRKDGIRIGKLEDLEDDARDEALDRIFKMACPDIDADDLTPGKALDLYTRIVAESYVTDSERKNLASPQPSVSKANSGPVASAKKTGSRNKGTAQKSRKKRG